MKFVLTKGREGAVVGALLLVAVAVQAWLYVSGRSFIDGDECSLGIQGLDILGGAWPAFFPGQDYMGCLEAYLLAGAYTVGAPVNGTTLRVVGMVEFLAFLISGWWLARRHVSREAGLITLALLALPPILLGWWAARIRGYLPVLAIGNLTLLALMPMIERGRAGRRPWLAATLGALLGLGWWANPISAIWIVTAGLAALMFGAMRRRLFFGWRRPETWAVNGLAAGVWLILMLRSLAVRRTKQEPDWFFQHRWGLLAAALAAAALLAAVLLRRRRGGNWRFALVCAGFIAGNAPAVVHSWTHAVLYTKHTFGSPREFYDYVELSLWYVFPDLVGLTGPRGTLTEFVQPPVLAIPLAGLYVLLAYLMARGWRTLGRPARCLLLAAAVAYALAGTQGSISWAGKRLMLPIYVPLMTLMALTVIQLGRTRWWLGAGALAVLLTAHAQSLLATPGRPLVLPEGMPPEERVLLDYCLEQGWDLVALHTANETAMRLNLNSGGKIDFYEFTDGFLRVPRYVERARASERLTVALPLGRGAIMEMGRAPDAIVGAWEIYRDVPTATIRGTWMAPFM
jgi:hypothetical protein